MKYLVIVYDGMADRPIPALGNKTPMTAARKPVLDGFALTAEVGTVLNVPAGMVPESDTANLAILSYDPRVYSRGRSPLEAVSMGLTMREGDVAYRTNIVALSEGGAYEERVMLDHSSDEISTKEADMLLRAVADELGDERKRFYTGISYRHCLLWDGGAEHTVFSRPHDILGQKIGAFLPTGEGAQDFIAMMKKSEEILSRHPLNAERRAKGLKAANSLWFWSPGKKPALPSFCDKWGVKATAISAVDLIKGIGLCAGMDVPDIPGVTGTVNTDYRAKAQAAIDAYQNGSDLVFLHFEGPDECGHRAETQNKVKCIESIDSLVLAPVTEYLGGTGEPFALLVLPDHPTPIEVRTHTSDPVPYLLWRSDQPVRGVAVFDEENAAHERRFLPDGTALMEKLFLSKPKGCHA